MSWTDRSAIETIKRLRDKFNVVEFVETGTFKGINAEFQARNFQSILTCEINPEFFKIAQKRLKHLKNVEIYNQDSPEFLNDYYNDYFDFYERHTPIFYLDAHFYNPNGPRWVVQNELESLAYFNNGIVIIHDFDNGLGHCKYDGESLGWKVVKDRLKEINPKFEYYTNSLEFCDPIRKPQDLGLIDTEDIRDNIAYMWSKPRLTYRGILYCLPDKLDDPKDFRLIKWN